MCFTDAGFDADIKFECGWVLLGILGVNVLFNLTLLIVNSLENVRHVFTKCKKNESKIHRIEP